MSRAMRWWFAGFVVAVFLAGTSVGVLVDRLWLLPRAGEGVQSPAGWGRGRMGGGGGGRVVQGPVEANLTRLQNILQLDESQRRQIRPMLEAWDGRIRSLQEATRDQLIEETRTLERDLSAVLTAEQQDRLSMVRNRLLVPRPALRGLGPEGRGRGLGRGGSGG